MMSSEGAKKIIVDAHAHFSGILYPSDKNQMGRFWGAEEIIKDMDELDVTAAIVSATRAMWWFNWRKFPDGGNEDVSGMIAKYPGRIFGCYVPNCYAEASKLRASVRDAKLKRGFCGLKIHPWLQSLPANARQLNPVFEVAEELDMPVIFHSGTIPYTTPAEIFDVAKRFPKLPIILAHAGKADMQFDVLALCGRADNLYIETSAQHNKVFLEKFVSEFGSRRVLFGSDWAGQDGRDKLRFRLLEIESLEIGQQQRADILGRNAVKLFKLKL